MGTLHKQVLDVLHNLNWLMESHNSSVELVEVNGNRVVVHCEGYCLDCETDCIGDAFRERMPGIELVLQ
jgi:Fe-S cluster biogenesis protein NfuA